MPKGIYPMEKRNIPSHSGFKHSEETKRIISLSSTGRPSAMKGKHITEEHRAKIIKSLTGRVCSEETKRKIGNANRGQVRSEKIRRDLSLQAGGTGTPYELRGYGGNFTVKLKKKIRFRDLFVCQMCGKNEEENKRKMSLHHIDYNKYNNSDVNLLCLCDVCHPKTNFNRKYWEEYFTRLMISKIRL